MCLYSKTTKITKRALTSVAVLTKLSKEIVRAALFSTEVTLTFQRLQKSIIQTGSLESKF